MWGNSGEHRAVGLGTTHGRKKEVGARVPKAEGCLRQQSEQLECQLPSSLTRATAISPEAYA